MSRSKLILLLLWLLASCKDNPYRESGVVENAPYALGGMDTTSIIESPKEPLVDPVVHDIQPELSLPSDRPIIKLDSNPPTILVQFRNAHKGKEQFAVLNGDVTFDVEAHDESGLRHIKMLAPQIEGSADDKSFGPISVDQIPQGLTAAEACGSLDVLKEEIAKRGLSIDNIVCACFEATDVSENSSRHMSCFQRAELEAKIGASVE